MEACPRSQVTLVALGVPWCVPSGLVPICLSAPTTVHVHSRPVTCSGRSWSGQGPWSQDLLKDSTRHELKTPR